MWGFFGYSFYIFCDGWAQIRNDKIVVIYKAFYLDVAQGRMNGAHNETQIHSQRFTNLVC